MNKEAFSKDIPDDTPPQQRERIIRGRMAMLAAVYRLTNGRTDVPVDVHEAAALVEREGLMTMTDEQFQAWNQDSVRLARITDNMKSPQDA